jgi:tripartite-type tricarboxylate transporter receptor subunit TctC
MTIRSTRREFLGASASASALLLAGTAGVRPAYAQYPERNLTLIVPYALAAADITRTPVGQDLEPVIGKPVTVENRGGGGGWIGWGTLAAAKPDGYTIGYLNVPSMYAGYLDPKVGRRKERLESFTPIINHVIDYNVWAVKADSPFKTVKDVIDAAKETAETITVWPSAPER